MAEAIAVQDFLSESGGGRPWKKRLQLRKEVEGDDVPESIMLEMKGGLNSTS